MRPRSRWVSTPANGEFCRSSHPLFDRDVMASSSSSTGPSRSRAHSPSQRAATPRGCAALRRRRFARARRRVRSGSVDRDAADHLDALLSSAPLGRRRPGGPPRLGGRAGRRLVADDNPHVATLRQMSMSVVPTCTGRLGPGSRTRRPGTSPPMRTAWFAANPRCRSR